MATPSRSEACGPTGAAGRESPIRVLLIEDDEEDYLLTRDLLEEIGKGRYVLEWVPTFQGAVDALSRQEYDVCLLDYRLGPHVGLELLRQPVDDGKPVILLTGQDDRDLDLQAMRAGASDFLVKGEIDSRMLERSIRYAIERKRSETALRKLQVELERRVQERTLALEQANEALQDADRRKDEFLAMLAHELRNPLAPIRNALHILKMPEAGLGTQRQARDMMERQLQHLVRLVDDLLDVSRIMRGKVELRREVVELAAVVERAVEMARPAIDAQAHELSVSLPDVPVRLEGDLVRLAQAVSNLLVNAAKYTDKSGRIWLGASREAGEVVVGVKDTGIGIAPELLPQIFDLFVQADRSLDRSQGGLGIGLTLVKRLVELHGGTVQAHSPGLGQGAEFTIRLPALPEYPAGVADTSNGAGGRSRGPCRRVLVVDDNVDAAESAALLLRMWGHEVQTVHNGLAVLDAARSLRPDFVLLDIGLPGMNGYEVARQLRSEPQLGSLVLAAMTGYGQEEDRRRSKEAGFNCHLTKPLDPETLKALVASPELAGKTAP